MKQKKVKQKVEVAIDDCEVNTRCPHCQSTTYRIPLRAFIGGSAEALCYKHAYGPAQTGPSAFMDSLRAIFYYLHEGE